MSTPANLKEINLLVFDEKPNFLSETTQQRIGKDLFKSVIPVSTKQEFEKAYKELSGDDKFVLICHVFHGSEGEKVPLRGYIHFSGLGIEDEYKIEAALVSAGDSGNVMKALWQSEHVARPVYLYTPMRENIKNGKIKVYSKNALENQVTTTQESTEMRNSIPQDEYDFAIITALYKDEFEQLKDDYDWNFEKNYSTKTMLYRSGNLKGRPDKKIIVGIPPATGMVDSAIIATEMLTIFKPKFLIMSGVCGGKPSLKFGDIVVASKIFTFQKGKISDIKNPSGEKLKLYDNNKMEIDYEHLYDKEGNQVHVSVEDFEVEHDSMIEIHTLQKQHIEGAIEVIQESINRVLKPFSKRIDIHFEPIACSTMVVNSQGFFVDKIKKVDRKVAAVEMESYGVARATKLSNNGDTIWIIFKSVMDNMKEKTDDAKTFAAKTSALFLKELLERDILK